jgi:hypothetical protein
MFRFQSKHFISTNNNNIGTVVSVKFNWDCMFGTSGNSTNSFLIIGPLSGIVLEFISESNLGLFVTFILSNYIGKIIFIIDIHIAEISL